MLERYGVTSVFKLPHIIEKRNAVMNSPESWAKRYETLRKHGKLNSSLPEEHFYFILSKIFKVSEIKRWVTINGWSIDFYVEPIDTFIQIDGVYWHGLDRPIEEIRMGCNERDVVIAKKFDRDRQQDEWFPLNGLKLIRITDRMLKEWGALKDDN